MKNSYLIIIYALLFIGQRVWGESVTQTVHFSYSKLICDTITGEDGQVYNLLSYGDLKRNYKLGSPALPVHYVSVPIPYLAENISLKAERRNVTLKSLSNNVFPNQMDIPTIIGNYEKSFIPRDSIIFNSSHPFPSYCVQIVSISSVGEDNRNVRVEISPITYYPLLNMIEFAEDIDITVYYTIRANSQTKKSTHSGTANNIGIPFYEYCIITSDSLENSFERLVAWRKQNGLNAGVVCVGKILNNPHIVGDTVSNIYDNAGKLREYLQYAYDSGTTKYVLFGGNYQVVPIRYGTGFKDSTNIDDQIPTDFYFSELTSNWDADGDSLCLGESNESLNYGGQLYVGRILCTSSNEVENYTNKVLRYELFPGNGNFSYLTKAFFQQADEMQLNPNGGQANYIATALGEVYTTKKIIQEIPGARSSNTISPYGKDIIDSMKVHYGYVSWFGHGHPNAITTKSDTIYNKKKKKWNYLYHPYGITSVEDDIPGMMHEDGNSLTCMGNKDYPMIAYSIACTITPFDTFKHYTEYPNIGQTFTLGKDYGGPALIGNTRNGWVSYSYLYQEKFNNYALEKILGEALVRARSEYCSSSTYPHFLAHSSNLIGCPFIRLWTDTPKLFSASLSYNHNNYIIMANSAITEAIIGIRDITQENETTDTLNFSPSQGAKTLTNAENCLITLTGKNCLPQIMPLTIQNDTLQGTHYAIVKDVACGKDVRNSNQGNVVFDENSNYTFETKGTFKLTKGVRIKQGAQLKIIPSEINY
jgi:hypothetical protein